MSTLEIRCLHEQAELVALSAQINALNLASERPDPFSSCEFYVNFLQHGLGESQDQQQPRLWFLAVLRGPHLIAYLALKQVTRKVFGMRARGLEFLVGHHVDQPHLVARAAHIVEATAAIYDYLLQRRREWSFLEFQGQTAASSLDPARAGLRLRRCLVREFPNWENCTIQPRWSSTQQYVQSMSRNSRGEVRRRLRRLLGLGKLELLSSSDPRATPVLFDFYCNIEARSWKSQTEIAIGNSVRTDYLKGLLDPRQPMRMLIQILLLEGVPIAGMISGAFDTPKGRTLHAMHLAFDSDLAAASPGAAVLLLGVRHAIEHGFVSMNLLSGFAYYKTRWLAAATPTHSIQIYRTGSLPYWKRRLGDFKRQLRSGTLRTEQWLFNPLRRQRIAQEQAENPAGECEVQVSDAERSRFATAIAQLRLAGLCEVLSPAEIAASAAHPGGEKDKTAPRGVKQLRCSAA